MTERYWRYHSGSPSSEWGSRRILEAGLALRTESSDWAELVVSAVAILIAFAIGLPVCHPG